MSDLFCEACGRPLAWEPMDAYWICGGCYADQCECDCEPERSEEEP